MKSHVTTGRIREGDTDIPAGTLIGTADVPGNLWRCGIESGAIVPVEGRQTGGDHRPLSDSESRTPVDAAAGAPALVLPRRTGETDLEWAIRLAADMRSSRGEMQVDLARRLDQELADALAASAQFDARKAAEKTAAGHTPPSVKQRVPSDAPDPTRPWVHP